MHPLRKEQEFIFENSDGDVEGHSTTEVSPLSVSTEWSNMIVNRYGIRVPNLYVVDSTRKLIPPHHQSFRSKEKLFTLHKGLLLFHTTIHEPGLNFKYPANEPFFSTTPSHGLGIAFQEKRQDVILKGYKARMMIFVLKADLIAVDNCGDCVRSNLGEEVAVAGYTENYRAWYNLNEIRIFKRSQEEMAGCLDYIAEFDLTEFILTDNPYMKYDVWDTLHLFRNRDVIINLPIPADFYKTSGWKPITSQLSAMWYMARLLYVNSEYNLDQSPIWFIISLFAVNQLWHRGEINSERSDLAMLILYNSKPKLIFLSDVIPPEDLDDDYLSAKKSLRAELEKHF